MDNQIKLSTTSANRFGRRPLDECIRILKSTPGQKLDDLSDDEVIELVRTKNIAMYKLESHFSNMERAIEVRRQIVAGKLDASASGLFARLPYEAYDYTKVTGSCCENVIGYVPVPLGVAGPLKIDGKLYHIPMATTEGTLVASTNRGCTALSVRSSNQFSFFRIECIFINLNNRLVRAYSRLFWATA